MSSIEDTLKERFDRYGHYHEHARITWEIKRAMQTGRNWEGLPDYMKEALHMIAHKVGRILNGDPYYDDSWHDIVGYTKLVQDRIKSEAVGQAEQDRVTANIIVAGKIKINPPEQSDWTGFTVRFTPSAAGLANGMMAEMEGQVITDIDGWLKIQCGPGLDALYSEPKSICSICGISGHYIDTTSQMKERLVPRNMETIIDDSSRHAIQEPAAPTYRDHTVMNGSLIGLKLLITKTQYDSLSPEMQRRYIVTGENCQLDRAQVASSKLEQSHLARFPRFYHQEDVRGLPEWTLEMYRPDADGYHLKDQFVSLWGK